MSAYYYFAVSADEYDIRFGIVTEKDAALRVVHAKLGVGHPSRRASAGQDRQIPLPYP